MRNFMLTTLSCRMKPKLWMKSKGIVIPKPGKADYTNPKSYRIINLSSNILKLMERGLLHFLQDDLKIDIKLISNQHGFRKGKSTISAIHDLTSRIENSLADKKLTLGAFIDIEGAFDKVSFSALEHGLDKFQIPTETYEWISHALRNRTVVLELGGESIERVIHRGTPQGGILSPLLWNLCMNTIQFTKCNLDLIILYADDIVIIISGIDLNSTMHDIIAEQMKILTTWVHKQGLKLSTAKTNIVAFHNPHQKINLKHLTIDNETLPIKPYAPYLGIDLDKHLSYKTHIYNKVKKATKAARPLNYLMNKNWGLSTSQARHIHNQIIMPNLLYAAGTWGHAALNNNLILNKLQTVQNIVTRKITNGHKHTHSATLTILAGTDNMRYLINKTRINNYIHLTINNNWWHDPNHGRRAKLTHSKDISDYLNKIAPGTKLDITANEILFFKPNRNITCEGNITIFTDGSRIKTDEGHITGAGAAIIYENSIKLTIQSLAPENTINQAELQAIHMCTNKLIENNTTKQNISFYTDSQTTLERLTNLNSNSKQLTSTIRALHKLQENNNVDIHKVKAHSNIADRGQQILCMDNINPIQTNQRLPKIIPLQEKPLEKLAISDQNNLNNSIAHKDRNETALCELCKVKENAEHKLIHCPDLEELRYRTGYTDIGNNVLSPMETLDIKKFNEIVTKCNQFE
eukprot:sb/3462640/